MHWKRLKEDYPNITINYDGSVHDDYQTIMMTYMASDSLPDVFNVKGSWIPNMVANGQLGTIDEFLRQMKSGQADLQTIFFSIWNMTGIIMELHSRIFPAR